MKCPVCGTETNAAEPCRLCGFYEKKPIAVPVLQQDDPSGIIHKALLEEAEQLHNALGIAEVVVRREQAEFSAQPHRLCQSAEPPEVFLRRMREEVVRYVQARLDKKHELGLELFLVLACAKRYKDAASTIGAVVPERMAQLTLFGTRQVTQDTLYRLPFPGDREKQQLSEVCSGDTLTLYAHGENKSARHRVHLPSVIENFDCMNKEKALVWTAWGERHRLEVVVSDGEHKGRFRWPDLYRW